MKRTLTALLVIFMAAASPVLADPPDEDVLRPRIGGRIGLFVEFDPGLNVSFLDGNPYVRPLFTRYEQETTIYRTGLGISPYLGLSVGYEFSTHIGITLHAAFDRRFASNSGTMVDTCFLADPVSGNSQANRMEVRKDYGIGINYLSLALLPNYNFGDLFFFAGPTIAIPLTRKFEETNSIISDSPCYYLVPGDDTTKSITGALTDIGNVKTRFSLKFGLGYTFSVAPTVDIVPQLALDIGLSDVLKQDEMLRMVNAERPEGRSVDIPINRQMRINTLQALVGIRVRL